MRRGIASTGFVRDLLTRIKEDRVTNGAAAVAFYAMLALFPAAIFALTLLPYLPIPNLERAVMDLLHQSMPGEAAAMFEQTVRGVVSTRHGGLLSFGFLLALWSASSGVYAVMQELDAVNRVRTERSFVRARGVALLLTIALVLLVIGALALAVAGGAIQSWMGDTLGWSGALVFLFAALRWAVIGLALLFAVALVYRFGPNVERRFALFTPGTMTGTVLLVLATLAFNLYVSRFGSYDKVYGSLGAVIALLMWLFLAGLALLVGAEVDVVEGTPRDLGARAGYPQPEPI